MAYEFKTEDVFNIAAFLNTQTREKGDELEFISCPYCQSGNNRQDKWTFAINKNTGQFKCLRQSCGMKGNLPILARDNGYELYKHETKAYRKFPNKKPQTTDFAIEWLKGREISEEVARKYNITTRKDDGKIITFPCYNENNELTFIKYRDTKKNPKSKEWCETNGKPILFGMNHCADKKRMVLTEGQLDSLSLATAGINNPVSVPTGANGFTWVEHCWNWLSEFEEIVVFGDLSGGKVTLVEELMKRVNVPIKVVQKSYYLGEKDANDILIKYGTQALIDAVENAKEPAVNGVKRLSDVQAVDMYDLPRIPTGIPEIDKLTGGLFLGNVKVISGKRGGGKSTVMSQIACEAINAGYKCFVYSGELKDVHFRNWFDAQLAGTHNMEQVRGSEGETRWKLKDGVADKLSEWYYDKVFIHDNDFLPSGNEMLNLLDVVELVIKQYGVKLICIDNLMTALDIFMEDLYKSQSAFVKKLKALAKKHNVAVILVAHPRKSSGKHIENDDVAGSADITNWVDVVMSFQRAEEESGYDGFLRVTKNRINGKVTRGDGIGVYYSQSCRRVNTDTSDKHKKYGWEVEREPKTIEIGGVEYELL